MAQRVSLFKILRRQLDDVLTAQGYAEVPQDASERNSTLLYAQKQSRRPRFGLWFQRNVKSSSVDANGSSFNLELFRSLANRMDLDQRKRAYYLLTSSEREEMRALQNRVIERLPPLESVLEQWEIKLFGSDLKAERKQIAKPCDPRHDVWMRYRDEEDIVAWASFIGRLLPDLAQRFITTPKVERLTTLTRPPRA